jgi:hypothetical protein
MNRDETGLPGICREGTNRNAGDAEGSAALPDLSIGEKITRLRASAGLDSREKAQEAQKNKTTTLTSIYPNSSFSRLFPSSFADSSQVRCIGKGTFAGAVHLVGIFLPYIFLP